MPRILSHIQHIPSTQWLEKQMPQCSQCLGRSDIPVTWIYLELLNFSNSLLSTSLWDSLSNSGKKACIIHKTPSISLRHPSPEVFVFFSCIFCGRSMYHLWQRSGGIAVFWETANWLQQDYNVPVTSLSWQPRWWKWCCIFFLLCLPCPPPPICIFITTTPYLSASSCSKQVGSFFNFKYSFTTASAKVIKSAYALCYPKHFCFIQHIDRDNSSFKAASENCTLVLDKTSNYLNVLSNSGPFDNSKSLNYLKA